MTDKNQEKMPKYPSANKYIQTKGGIQNIHFRRLQKDLKKTEEKVILEILVDFGL